MLQVHALMQVLVAAMLSELVHAMHDPVPSLCTCQTAVPLSSMLCSGAYMNKVFCSCEVPGASGLLLLSLGCLHE